MWMQAQNLVVAGPMDWNAPLGAVIVIGLLLVTALGVPVQSSAVAALVDWLMGDEERRPAPVATSPPRCPAFRNPPPLPHRPSGACRRPADLDRRLGAALAARIATATASRD